MTGVDEVLDLLGDERRRRVLYYLRDADRSESVSVDELVEAVAAAESDGGADVEEATLERLKVNLQHVHLPKAAEAEFVRYDREAGEVGLVSEPAEFDELVAVAEEYDRDEGSNAEGS
ncbi:hypothetical protein ACFQE1_21430 [Halobium palmae]|uniref:DUF7344 domain-containing protein n=1 Tax=Halobium palmae TaxID=1776492 RepID=A0ABD5S5T5_9EURY